MSSRPPFARCRREDLVKRSFPQYPRCAHFGDEHREDGERHPALAALDQVVRRRLDQRWLPHGRWRVGLDQDFAIDEAVQSRRIAWQ